MPEAPSWPISVQMPPVWHDIRMRESLVNRQDTRSGVSETKGISAYLILGVVGLFGALAPGGVLSVTEVIFDPHFQTRSTVTHFASEAGFKKRHSSETALRMSCTSRSQRGGYAIVRANLPHKAHEATAKWSLPRRTAALQNAAAQEPRILTRTTCSRLAEKSPVTWWLFVGLRIENLLLAQSHSEIPLVDFRTPTPEWLRLSAMMSKITESWGEVSLYRGTGRRRSEQRDDDHPQR